MSYHEICHKHRGHIKVIDKQGALRCAKDGVVVSKKPRLRDDDDMGMPMGKFDPEVLYIEPHEVLFSTRKPDGWKKLFDKENSENE